MTTRTLVPKKKLGQTTSHFGTLSDLEIFRGHEFRIPVTRVVIPKSGGVENPKQSYSV